MRRLLLATAAAVVAAAAAIGWAAAAPAGTAWYWRVAPLAALTMLVGAGAIASAAAGRRRHTHAALTRAILASAPDAVIVLDERGTVVEFNRAAERMLGLPRERAVGAPLDDGLLLPETPVAGAGPVWTWGPDGRFDVTATRADGGTFPAELAITPVTGVRERLQTLHLRDVSARRQAERAAFDLAAIVQSSEDAIVSKTLDGVIESWNRGAERMYGHTAAEAIGQRISLVEPRGRHDDSPAVLALIRRGHPVENLETVRVRKDGGEVDVSLTVSPIVDAHGRVIAAAEIGRDITARRRSEQRVAYLAYHDDLTGLPNRLMFQEHLDLALARAQRHDRAVAVLYVDLDNFKHVNDTHGHEAGDDLLRQIARRLEAATRATDLVARQGGDEFLVLVTDLPTGAAGDGSDARDIAGTIAAHIEQALAAPATVGEESITAGGSVGVALYPEDAGTRDELLRRADEAMYRAKGRVPPGGGAVPAAARVPLTARLRLALERGEFVLHYQPVLRLADTRMVGVEALIRWNHPEDGLLPPASFIPLAERSNLITAISDWVVEEVCRVSRPWLAGDMGIDAALNLPLAHWHEDAAARLLRTIRTGGLDPAQIVVEVSESSAMTDPDRTRPILDELHRNGVKLAIDDFGTGHSSLSRLTEMPVSTIKIDRAFVRGVPDDPHANAIATTIIQLARNIGAEALAEGIETPAQREFLAREGCALGQGFLFSPAVPAAEVEPLYRRFEPAAAGA